MKTVVELDLVGYGVVSDLIEQGSDPRAVAGLNQDIAGLIASALTRAGGTPGENLAASTGDGGILVFDDAAMALTFAIAVHEEARAFTKDRKAPTGKRVFRVGMATGEMVLERAANGAITMAGTTIARAVRLESNATPGSILADAETYAGLEHPRKAEFSSERTFEGKRGETFAAHMLTVDPTAPDAAAVIAAAADALHRDPPLRYATRGAPKKPVRSSQAHEERVMEIFGKLDDLRDGQHIKLCLLLGIRTTIMPDRASIADQETVILKWAGDRTERIEQLERNLDRLLDRD
jgi:hypothetical protein